MPIYMTIQGQDHETHDVVAIKFRQTQEHSYGERSVVVVHDNKGCQIATANTVIFKGSQDECYAVLDAVWQASAKPDQRNVSRFSVIELLAAQAAGGGHYSSDEDADDE